MPTRILSRTDVAHLCNMEMALDAVETAFAAHGRGESRMPVKVYLPLPSTRAIFAPCRPISQAPRCEVGELASAEPGAPQVAIGHGHLHPVRSRHRAAPRHHGCHAPDGLSHRRLGRRGDEVPLWGKPKSVGFVGCGVQARYLLAAHRALFSDFDVLVADLVEEACCPLCGECGGRAVPINEAAGCDVVCTSTPSRLPVVARLDVREGAHVNAIGADAPASRSSRPSS